MPFEVEKPTVKPPCTALFSVNVNVNGVVPLLPSASVTSFTAMLALSSLLIVPTPVPSAIVAPVGLERFRLNVSLASSTVSPLTVTVTVAVSAPPAVKLTVWPLIAV